MRPLPERFTGRWDNPVRQSYDDTVCWHLLLGGDAAVQAAAAVARQRLAGFTGLHMTPPEWLHVTVQRVFYHPEAIALSVSPPSALSPVRTAARTAIREVLGTDADDGDEWLPHLTPCYSTTEQPAAP